MVVKIIIFPYFYALCIRKNNESRGRLLAPRRQTKVFCSDIIAICQKKKFESHGSFSLNENTESL